VKETKATGENSTTTAMAATTSRPWQPPRSGRGELWLAVLVCFLNAAFFALP